MIGRLAQVAGASSVWAALLLVPAMALAQEDAGGGASEDEGGLLEETVDWLAADEAGATAENQAEDELAPDDRLIERGEAFTGLEIPCGDEGCEALAQRFCDTLGYGEPIGFLDMEDRLYVVRCTDDI